MPVVTANTAVSVGEAPICSATPMPIGAVMDLTHSAPTMVSSAPNSRAISTALTTDVTPPPIRAAISGSQRPRSEATPL